MIVARAPLRVSFVGGGTDLPEFYGSYPGRVVSAAINKYVFLALNRTPLIDKISARYSTTETVNHPSELLHTRIRAALLDMEIFSNVEIGSFASLPAKTGLGSSSSFSVALLAALHAYLGRSADAHQLARLACRLEIDLLGEPIGKQDQYAAAFGGINVFEFRSDGSVDVRPVPLPPPLWRKLEYHTLVFYTGMTRFAASVLTEQRANIASRGGVLRQMSDAVLDFEQLLLRGDIRALGGMLHENWQRKKCLSSNVSNGVIDELYESGMAAGAWGGKLLGAGGGGCILFLAPPEHQDGIRDAVLRVVSERELFDFREMPVSFVHHGAGVVFNGNYDQ
jgi:D-glycero-alpha-D-manno-heptose-7-phosphate kinase